VCVCGKTDSISCAQADQGWCACSSSWSNCAAGNRYKLV